eukprot:1150143-Pelagomonas_calceolata.AAC.1
MHPASFEKNKEKTTPAKKGPCALRKGSLTSTQCHFISRVLPGAKGPLVRLPGLQTPGAGQCHAHRPEQGAINDAWKLTHEAPPETLPGIAHCRSGKPLTGDLWQLLSWSMLFMCLCSYESGRRMELKAGIALVHGKCLEEHSSCALLIWRQA